MAIITISRGTFAGGARLAELLGTHLCYRVVSREQLYETARVEHGIDAEEFAALMDRPLDIFDRTARQRRRLLLALQTTMCGLVRDDCVVYHGNNGHLFLAGIAHVLRVRLIAPRAMRVRLACEREGLTEDEASVKIDRVDAERERWSMFFYGLHWAEPSLYDLTLNLERLALVDAVYLTGATAQLAPYQTTNASRSRLRDLTLESRVKLWLLTDPVTASSDIEVEVQGATVRLIGLWGDEQARWASEHVRHLPGVEAVAVAPVAEQQ